MFEGTAFEIANIKSQLHNKIFQCLEGDNSELWKLEFATFKGGLSNVELGTLVVSPRPRIVKQFRHDA